MVNNYDDTIFSLATAVGRSATAMVRISGPRVNDVPELLGFARPKPKIATTGTTFQPAGAAAAIGVLAAIGGGGGGLLG